MTTNLEKLQAQHKRLRIEVDGLQVALDDSGKPSGNAIFTKHGFGVRLGVETTWLRDDETVEILQDAVVNIIAIKQRQIDTIAAKLAAIEELLE